MKRAAVWDIPAISKSTSLHGYIMNPGRLEHMLEVEPRIRPEVATFEFWVPLKLLNFRTIVGFSRSPANESPVSTFGSLSTRLI